MRMLRHSPLILFKSCFLNWVCWPALCSACINQPIYNNQHTTGRTMFLHYVWFGTSCHSWPSPLLSLRPCSLSLIKIEGKFEKSCSTSPQFFFIFFYSKNYTCVPIWGFSHFSHVLKKDYYLLFNHNSEGRYFTYISAHIFVVRANTLFSIVIKTIRQSSITFSFGKESNGNQLK